MLDAFVGEIQIFSFGYAPPNWALCDGAEVRIKDHPGLYSLIGTTYGSSDADKFRLPNLSGRAVCGQGAGPQLTARKPGDSFGVNSVSLEARHLPEHSHGVNFFTPRAEAVKSNLPAKGDYLGVPDKALLFAPSTAGQAAVTMAQTASAVGGGDAAHENRQPLLALSFYIALRGEMPAFS